MEDSICTVLKKNISILTFPAKRGNFSYKMSKMKLITNENNIDALKIVIAASEVKEDLEIEYGTGVVPCLVDEKLDLKLFVSNAACQYLHENANLLKKRAIGAVEKHLNWESETLRPILSIYHSTNKVNDDLKKALEDQIMPVLVQSEGPLTNYPQNKDAVSANDIVIWCDLYPLWQDNHKVFQDLPRVKTWMEYLGSKESFKKGLSIVFKQGYNKKTKLNFSSWNKKVVSGLTPVESSAKKAENVSKQQSNCCESAASKEGPPITKEELEIAKKAWNRPLKNVKKQKTGQKILPIKGERNVLITSALPYVNNVPHLGNIVGKILKAIFHRNYFLYT